jgi:glycosyltransferase involved in cell wall biosynthesis
VYDGIDRHPERPDAAAARTALGLPADAPVIGSVTRLSRQKRLDRTLEALALLPGVHCALAGEGELEGKLRARAQALGVADRVHFLGYRTDVHQVLAALDVFVLTSEREGMANAMLEAMAAGVPVVSTPVSGAYEALAADDQGRAPGVIVDGEAAAIADAVRGILEVAAPRMAMGEEGRRRAGERFGYARMIDAWESVLAGQGPEHVHQGTSLP